MTGSYDPWLVLLSIVVAVVASSVGLDLASRVVATRGRPVARYWLLAGAVSMGTGIWSMHFIGMLALRLPMRMSYHAGLTAASLLVAVAASGIALQTVARRTLDMRSLIAAGGLMGCAIASMHYMGMAAMDLPAPLRYRWALVGASIAIAIGASILALQIAFALRGETLLSAFRKKFGSAALLGIAISGMHYTGMAAAIFPPLAMPVHPGGMGGMDSPLLAAAVGAFAFLLLATTLLVSMVDAHFATRAHTHVGELRAVNGQLAIQAGELALANSRLQAEIDERMRSEARARHLAFHDGLTGLPNRALFSQLLDQALVGVDRRRSLPGVMFIDLDRFKIINDTLGHQAGDALLREVADRLLRCVGGQDVVARLGGDEFVILVPQAPDRRHLAGLAQAVLAALVRPYAIFGQEFHVTASIGIAMYPDDGADERTLMRHADVAMYRAKAGGRNNLHFYEQGMDDHAFQRLAMETSLRHALERDEFVLHYQPKVDAATGRIAGVEALLRWRRPGQGLVLPGAFLHLAEETGLIVPIGNWVLRTACLQHAAWCAGGHRIDMAVNLSPCQFSDEHLLRDIGAILDDCRMDPTLLELEIVESTLMHDVDKAIVTLTALSTLGIRIAIDAFGSGYSSLATLKRFAINTIKVDRSIIRDFRGAEADHAIAAAILAMGRALSTTVIAEGVETGEQADYLRGQAYDQLQGFHFRQAMPADEVEALLRGGYPRGAHI